MYKAIIYLIVRNSNGVICQNIPVYKAVICPYRRFRLPDNKTSIHLKLKFTLSSFILWVSQRVAFWFHENGSGITSLLLRRLLPGSGLPQKWGYLKQFRNSEKLYFRKRKRKILQIRIYDIFFKLRSICLRYKDSSKQNGTSNEFRTKVL